MYKALGLSLKDKWKNITKAMVRKVGLSLDQKVNLRKCSYYDKAREDEAHSYLQNSVILAVAIKVVHIALVSQSGLTCWAGRLDFFLYKIPHTISQGR